MKKLANLSLLSLLFIASSCSSFSPDHKAPSRSMASKEDLLSSKKFVATCPEQYLTYYDKSEGGPGAYCACPESQISYLDKREGGPGFYCESKAPKEEKDIDLLSSKRFISTCPEKYLTYLDKREGGPGAFCACPEDKISYIDKSEGGPGSYCEE